MNKLFVPRRGSNITCFSFYQNVIKTAFKKSLIYLVIFCFAFAPLFNVYNVFAQEFYAESAISQDAVLAQPNDQVFAEPLKDQLLNDAPGDKSADLPNLDLPNGPDSDITPNTETVNDPENPIEPQQQSLSQNNNSGETPDINPNGKQKINLHTDVDEVSGGLNYSYNLNIPQGRNGMNPNVALNYNSSSKENDSPFGYGWNISIPYIERLNRHGSESIYEYNEFTSSLDGELVEFSPGVYVPKNQNGSFNKYIISSNGWYFIDKSGVKYYFGVFANERLDDPNNTSHVYRWYLNKTEDLNGNFVSYEYFKDNNQIYPKNIYYTGNGSTNGIYKVSFFTESRPDNFYSYSTGFPIKTNYRINKVEVSVDGFVRQTYSIIYTLGNNQNRSLLSSITESFKGSTGLTTTKPPTVFEYQSNINGWVYDNTTSIPIHFRWVSGADSGVRVMDVNGDSLSDFVRAEQGYDKEIWLNNGNGWTQNTTINFPLYFNANDHKDLGVRYADINGDGLVDLVRSQYDSVNPVQEIWLNNGNGWTQNTTINFPAYFVDEYFNDIGSYFLDVNGDGLVDILYARQVASAPATYIKEVWLNNGNGWTKNTNYKIPFEITNINHADLGTRFFDVNGDGLVDVVISHQSYSAVYINDGNGWVLDSSISIPFKIGPGDADGCRLSDVNGDGLTDVLCGKNYGGGNSQKSVWISTGGGFIQDNNIVLPHDFAESSVRAGSELTDTNGDGLDDIVVAKHLGPNTYEKYYFKTNGLKNDLLKKVNYQNGGSGVFIYKMTAEYKDASGNLLNPNLAMNLNTVESIMNNDGFGNISKTSYEYADGYYYYNNAFDRKFAGFGKVVQTNADNTKQISYYSQGNATDTANGEYDDSYSEIGRTYRTDLLDANNNLIKQDTTKWESSQNGTANAYFVYPSQTMSRIFTGSNSYDTAEGYDYNTNTGNLSSKTEYGNVASNGYQSFTDMGTDSRKTEYGYTNCTSGGCLPLQLISRIVVSDYSNSKISEQKKYYDNSLFGVATAGNNTKIENWVSGSNYVTIQKTYNLFGMPTSVTDARNNTNNINYDIYNLYPSSVTNALSQTTSYVYDYNTGKVVRTVDANGTAAETDYDGFGRPTAERSSSDTSYSSLINTSSYLYNDTMGAGGMVPYVQKTTYYSPTLSGTSYTLTDGLGREVRSITQAGPSSYVASDTAYDNMGRVIKKSLPYNFSGSPINYSGPTTNNNIISTNTYDSLGRITTSTNTLGTNTNIYNLNTTTTIDPDNHSKDIVRNAFGNIVSVIEHNGANTYTTNYNWDGLGNLIGLTDALGNVRTFTYDAQGNRLSATDLHASTDTAYGSYTYSYDANNNLVQKNTPNGDVVTYIYDALNRPTRESNNSVAQINYTYDICVNGIGKLCSVNRAGSSTKTFAYTNRGLVSSDTTMFGTKNWLNSYVYNYAGNPVQITYPDNSSVRYTYDNRGLITQIEKQDTATGAWANVITNITYNPLGQKEGVQYANGRTQNYTYDANNQYRLTRNTLDAPMGYAYPKFFDTLYAWSPSGNLTQKTENFNLSNPQTFAYTYDDLSRLTGVTKTVNAPLIGYAESYTYNALGNIINKTGPGSYMYAGTNPGVYANPHAATSVGSINYGYDKNGNLTGWGTTPNNTALNYNYRNELTGYVKISAPAVNNIYVYDYSGARIKTTTSAGTTYSPSKYFDENATINKRYIYLNDQLVATVEVGGTGTSTINYIHPDYLGGTQMVTDSAGAIKKQDLEYYPFGEILANTKMGGFDEKHKYTGHEYDADTGLNFMQARYQYGKEGRFWQQDPIIRELDNSKLETLLTDPQRWNSYSYASNNPVKNIDLDGNQAVAFYLINNLDGLKNLTALVTENIGSTIYQYPIANIGAYCMRNNTWDKVTDERIRTLDPSVQQSAFDFVNRAETRLDTKLRVTDAYRSNEKQAELYNQSRTKPPTGPWVTDAEAGESYHNYGFAIDVAVMEGGRAYARPVDKNIADIAKQQGFQWGGLWPKPKTDLPHFQMTTSAVNQKINEAKSINESKKK